MGIGLSSQHVSTNRLPGWDKMSYGYHGDDGNAFCGSGTGKSQAQGPPPQTILFDFEAIYFATFVKLALQ